MAIHPPSDAPVAEVWNEPYLVVIDGNKSPGWEMQFDMEQHNYASNLFAASSES
jgi:hypothetical protein